MYPTKYDARPDQPIGIQRLIVEMQAVRRPNTRLRFRREQVPFTQAELAERVGVAELTIRRWETEGLRPQPAHLRRLCAVLGASRAQLGHGQVDPAPTDPALVVPLGELPDPLLQPDEEDVNRREFLQAVALAPEVLCRVLRTAGAEAMEFTKEIGVSGVGTGTLDHLEAVIIDLDQSYSKEAPADQFAVARAYRVRVQTLIQGRHTFKEGRQLYVCAAWLDEALAWLSHDLGDPLTAESYAIDCFERADQVGHDELCAWATDAMASIAMYANRPERAATAARRGSGKAPISHPLAVRLRAQAARAHARLGQRDEYKHLFAEAKDLYEVLPSRTPMRFTVDTGPLAAYAVYGYQASSSIWLGDFQQAKRYAEEAVAVHKTAPSESRSPSREAIARIDLGIALAELGAPDEAVGQGRLALESPRVVGSVRSRAADLDAVLTARYPELGATREFHEEYQELVRPRP
jgi:transcriptional regulator with XRE-family HTH domain